MDTPLYSETPPQQSRVYLLVFFVALLATACAFGAALAHVLELPNKIGLPRDEYFIVQKAYRGWNQLAYLLAVELIAMIVLAVMSRRTPPVLVPVLLAILFFAAAQVVFWVHTFPANVATANWTLIPENWETWRQQWEYSHAVGAFCQFLALSSLIAAALRRGSCTPVPPA